GTGNRYVASSGRSVWLRKVCSTRVVATWSSIRMVTLWSSIASGGSVFSSGISRPAPRTPGVQASRTVKTTAVRRIALPFRIREIVRSPLLRRCCGAVGLSRSYRLRQDIVALTLRVRGLPHAEREGYYVLPLALPLAA